MLFKLGVTDSGEKFVMFEFNSKTNTHGPSEAPPPPNSVHIAKAITPTPIPHHSSRQPAKGGVFHWLK